jgi:hypothetical protein
VSACVFVVRHYENTSKRGSGGDRNSVVDVCGRTVIPTSISVISSFHVKNCNKEDFPLGSECVIFFLICLHFYGVQLCNRLLSGAVDC